LPAPLRAVLLTSRGLRLRPCTAGWSSASPRRCPRSGRVGAHPGWSH